MEGYWNYTEVHLVIQENKKIPTWWLITPHTSSMVIWLNNSWLFLDIVSYSSLWFSFRILCSSPLRFVPIRKNLRKNVVLSNPWNAKNTSLSDRSHLKWVVGPTSVLRKSFSPCCHWIGMENIELWYFLKYFWNYFLWVFEIKVISQCIFSKAFEWILELKNKNIYLLTKWKRSSKQKISTIHLINKRLRSISFLNLFIKVDSKHFCIISITIITELWMNFTYVGPSYHLTNSFIYAKNVKNHQVMKFSSWNCLFEVSCTKEQPCFGWGSLFIYHTFGFICLD